MSDTGIQVENRTKLDVNEEMTLLFLHIGKTASNTLRMIFQRKFPQDAVYRFKGGTVEDFQKSMAALECLSEEDRYRIRYIWGGVFPGMHKYLPQSSIYYSMFRDPVDRVISEYYWVLQRRTNLAHNEVVSKNMSLEDYVKNGVWRAWNCQTRMIRRVPEVSPPGDGPVLLSTNDLEIAKAILRQHFVVGLTERFDESLILLKRAFGWRTKNILYVKQNVSRNRPPKDKISSETVKLIEDHNELDIKLYEFVKRMFEEQLRQQGFSFRVELRIFRLFNKLYGLSYRLPHQIRSIKGVVLLRALVGLLLALVRRDVQFSYVYNRVLGKVKAAVRKYRL
jgi:hypothetical protein